MEIFSPLSCFAFRDLTRIDTVEKPIWPALSNLSQMSVIEADDLVRYVKRFSVRQSGLQPEDSGDIDRIRCPPGG